MDSIDFRVMGQQSSRSQHYYNCHVAVFGGFGMTTRHLRPLSKLYKKIGVENVSMLCHPLQELCIPAIGTWRARKVAKWLESITSEAPLVIHLFSRSVFLFFRALSYVSDASRQTIVGIIFECSPIDCKAEQFGRYLSWSLGKDYSVKYAIPFTLLRPIFGINRLFESRHQREQLLLPTHAAAHFINCTNDKIVNLDYIRVYQEKLARRGHKTSLTVHNQARHCQAIADNSRLYNEDIRKFYQTLHISERK